MKSLANLNTLWQMLGASKSGDTHQSRLESFYQPQAVNYDNFRTKLLHGRAEMIRTVTQLSNPANTTWLDVGAGTGWNLEVISSQVKEFKEVILLDLCNALLEQAQKKISANGWKNTKVVRGDATRSRDLIKDKIQLVTFSYSLSMIPDWYLALEQAYALMEENSLIGVVDFYVSRKFPPPERKKHSWLTRSLSPLWFAHDNVFLNPDHLPYLLQKFSCCHLEENLGSLPYLPGVKVPYYVFVGRKLRDQ